jgi:hypothetical protein
MSAGNRQGAARAQKALHPQFFAKYTVLRQENARDFDRLLMALQESYEPATPREDLAVMRLAQAHWRLRRLDTMEAVVYESQIEKAREHTPKAHPAAVLAAEYLSQETPMMERFRSRIQEQREDLEKQIARISEQLQNLRKERLFGDGHGPVSGDQSTRLKSAKRTSRRVYSVSDRLGRQRRTSDSAPSDPSTPL